MRSKKQIASAGITVLSDNLCKKKVDMKVGQKLLSRCCAVLRELQATDWMKISLCCLENFPLFPVKVLRQRKVKKVNFIAYYPMRLDWDTAYVRRNRW